VASPTPGKLESWRRQHKADATKPGDTEHTFQTYRLLLDELHAYSDEAIADRLEAIETACRAFEHRMAAGNTSATDWIWWHRVQRESFSISAEMRRRLGGRMVQPAS